MIFLNKRFVSSVIVPTKIIVVAIFFLFLAYMLTSFKHMKAQQDSFVQLEAQPKETLFFYRKDCPDCKKVLPGVERSALLKKNVIFVNLSIEENRTYIKKYSLRSVPTFITQKERYEGTNNKKIKTILEE